MNPKMFVYLRRFPVMVRDVRNGERMETSVVLEKSQLQAAQIVGQSSKELIERIYERQGFQVLDIGKADKLTVALDLEGLWELYRHEEEGGCN